MQLFRNLCLVSEGEIEMEEVCERDAFALKKNLSRSTLVHDFVSSTHKQLLVELVHDVSSPPDWTD